MAFRTIVGMCQKKMSSQAQVDVTNGQTSSNLEQNSKSLTACKFKWTGLGLKFLGKLEGLQGINLIEILNASSIFHPE